MLYEFPKRVEIELVSDCNLRCVYCPRHHVNDLTGYMDFELFTRIIDEVSSYPDRVITLHRRGESLMHPRLIEMCAYVKGKFQEIQIATNGTLLNKSRSLALIDSVDFISFSLDHPENFDKTRLPAKYASVELNILKFLEWNQGKVRTQVSMVETDDTPRHYVDEFKEIWNGKVDRIRVYQEHSKGGVFGSLEQPRVERKPCMMPQYECLIYCDGKVGRCNHDWNGDPMGDVNTHTLREVWYSHKYQDLRRQHDSLCITDAVCSGCDSWYPLEGVQDTGEVVETGQLEDEADSREHSDA